MDKISYMKASEFRIGNYYLDIDNKLSELSGYELWQMSVSENNDNLGVMEFQPIPLTEEWLLKFGFERGGYDMIEVSHPSNPRFVLYGYLDNDSDYLGWNYDTEVDIKGTTFRDSLLKIKYVHQLQNLYFALTNEELTID